jgi:hypothetical protein
MEADMSDGPSDCARRAESRAIEFAKEKYPNAKKLKWGQERPPKSGDFYDVQEDWLDHILTIFRGGKVIHRFRVPPFGKIVVATKANSPRLPTMRHYCG